MTDKYPNLPGHLTEFKDGGLKLVQEVNPPKTESVLILGTAVDGPVMEPVKVDASTFEVVFGKSADVNGFPNGSTATMAFEEAYAAGCRDIRVMRISGSPARATVKCAESIKVEEKIHEGILGYANGNVADNSKIFLDDVAESIVSVEANGIRLANKEFRFVPQDIIEKMFTDGKQVFEEKDTIKLPTIPGENKIVEIATEDIYAHVSDPEDFRYESELPLVEEVPDTDNYTIVAQKGIDYVVKGAITAAEAYVVGTKEGSFAPLMKPTFGDAILEPVKTSSVTVLDNVTDSSALIKVTYKVAGQEGAGTTKVANSSAYTPTFIAKGEALEIKLVDAEGKNIVPETGMTRIYFNGAEYTEADALVEDATQKIFKVVVAEKEAKIVIQPGKHAKRGAKIETRFSYRAEVVVSPEISIETSFGGDVYNETQYQVEKIGHAGGVVETVLNIVKPVSKRSQTSEAPLSYSSFDYPTLGLLVRAIANDANNGAFVKAYVNDAVADVKTTDLETVPTAMNFTGGDNGVHLSKQELFYKLSGKRDASGYLTETGAYQILENYTVDYVVPVGVHADDVLLGRFDNFAYELALFCAVVSHRNHATIGVIATSSPTEPTLRAVEDHVEKLQQFENIYFMRDAQGEVIRDSENQPLDLGKYINVIAGGDVIMNNQRLGSYATNSAAAFAGFLSQLAVNSAPTNKVLSYARGLRIKYSNAQLDRLTASRYITLKYKNDGATVAVVDSMTASAPGSDYERTATMRAVRELANEIREVADPFLGEPNTPQQRNALSSLIDKRLDQHKEAGTMRDYSFQLVATAYDELVGQATIELTIVPSQELRKITTVISLKPSI